MVSATDLKVPDFPDKETILVEKFFPIKFADISPFMRHTHIIRKSPYVTEHLTILRVQMHKTICNSVLQ